MNPTTATGHPTIVPCLRYRNAPAAIAWLEKAFGFKPHLVVPNEDGTIAHAQLVLGNGMIMLGTANKSGFGEFLAQPEEVGGRETQTVYAIVPDADLVYTRAKAAGAVIVMEIQDEDYGGRGFTCRDLEGRLWSLGTYDPWAETSR